MAGGYLHVGQFNSPIPCQFCLGVVVIPSQALEVEALESKDCGLHAADGRITFGVGTQKDKYIGVSLIAVVHVSRATRHALHLQAARNGVPDRRLSRRIQVRDVGKSRMGARKGNLHIHSVVATKQPSFLVSRYVSTLAATLSVPSSSTYAW